MTTSLDSVNSDALLSRVFELARQARRDGDHPFGALLWADGEIVAEASNRVNRDHDLTAHAETELVRFLEREDLLDIVSRGVVYASCEPCPMCVGAMFWAGTRRVVYGLSSERLAKLASPSGTPPHGFKITAAEIGVRCTPPIVFDGPQRQDEAAEPHIGFWVTR